MNSQELFKKAKLATSKLNPLIDTPDMRKTIMLAVVAQWVADVEPFIDGRDIADNIVKTAKQAIDLIYQELNK